VEVFLVVEEVGEVGKPKQTDMKLVSGEDAQMRLKQEFPKN
jgi:hypothetical protein